MIHKLLGGLYTPEMKEQAIKDTLTDNIENIREELSCKHDEFIIVIKPTTDENAFKCFILKSTPQLLTAIPGALHREITVSEIVTEKKE